MDYSFQCNVNNCPDCGESLNEFDSLIVEDRHQCHVDPNTGDIMESMTEQTFLIMDTRFPVVECDNCRHQLLSDDEITYRIEEQ